MPENLLSYARAGVVEEYSGRNWLDRDICPYCRASLRELGSFHVPASNLFEVRNNDKPQYIQSGRRIYQLDPSLEFKEGEAFCLNCGCTSARIDKSRPPVRSDHYYGDFYHPLNVTPGRNCFFKVAVCDACGWWYVVENAEQDNDGYAAVYAGILQSFDLSSATIPLQVLQAELPKNLHRIDGIHPKRMQDLVGHILAGVYDCEVHQLGYTRDGGIDLVLLNCDEPVAVQVKRREDHSRAEGVRGIREFLGAGLLRGFRQLIYATNAERYSAAAHQDAHAAVEQGLVERYDLVSLDILKNLFPKPESVELWREAIMSVIRREFKMPPIPDPYEVVN